MPVYRKRLEVLTNLLLPWLKDGMKFSMSAAVPASLAPNWLKQQAEKGFALM
jgi:hypothetical protein